MRASDAGPSSRPTPPRTIGAAKPAKWKCAAVNVCTGSWKPASGIPRATRATPRPQAKKRRPASIASSGRDRASSRAPSARSARARAGRRRGRAGHARRRRDRARRARHVEPSEDAARRADRRDDADQVMRDGRGFPGVGASTVRGRAATAMPDATIRMTTASSPCVATIAMSAEAHQGRDYAGSAMSPSQLVRHIRACRLATVSLRVSSSLTFFCRRRVSSWPPHTLVGLRTFGFEGLKHERLQLLGARVGEVLPRSRVFLALMRMRSSASSEFFASLRRRSRESPSMATVL